jgi:hypothetical protein
MGITQVSINEDADRGRAQRLDTDIVSLRDIVTRRGVAWARHWLNFLEVREGPAAIYQKLGIQDPRD